MWPTLADRIENSFTILFVTPPPPHTHTKKNLGSIETVDCVSQFFFFICWLRGRVADKRKSLKLKSQRPAVSIWKGWGKQGHRCWQCRLHASVKTLLSQVSESQVKCSSSFRRTKEICWLMEMKGILLNLGA